MLSCVRLFATIWIAKSKKQVKARSEKQIRGAGKSMGFAAPWALDKVHEMSAKVTALFLG